MNPSYNPFSNFGNQPFQFVPYPYQPQFGYLPNQPILQGPFPQESFPHGPPPQGSFFYRLVTVPMPNGNPIPNPALIVPQAAPSGPEPDPASDPVVVVDESTGEAPLPKVSHSSVSDSVDVDGENASQGTSENISANNEANNSTDNSTVNKSIPTVNESQEREPMVSDERDQQKSPESENAASPLTILNLGLKCSEDDCLTSGDIYPGPEALKKHLLDVHNIENYRCLVKHCGASFATRIIGKHVESAHAHRTDGTNPWQCGKCHRSFRSYESLANHNRYMHRRFVYMCSHCDTQSEYLKELIVHQANKHRKTEK